MAGMAAFWLVVIALLVWGAVRLISARPQSGEDAQEILDRRFAAGEIDRDPIAQRSQSWQQLSCGSVPSPGNEQLRFAGWAFSPQVTEVAVWICRFAPGAGRTVFARRQ
ncbi:hypothetical protein BJF84_20725 [Rhodococcus sp. CUA-806]|nr:hypothetical protein BJF84_20725 [Rhodococcus sp. CUA-806]